MPRTATPLAAALLGLCLVAGSLSAAPQHTHAEHAQSSGEPVPVPAERWATDAPLRHGMGRIHAALQALPTGNGQDKAAELRQVEEIEAGAAYIFANCKLAPQADTVMHGMLFPLLAATQKYRADPAAAAAAVRAMHQAVSAYPVYFDDPDWPASDASDASVKHRH